MFPLSQRPTYTSPQLSQWLALLPQTISLEDLRAQISQQPLDTLRQLQLWQLATIPFGNLILHYSTHHSVSLDPETLFTKIVERRMGGYCMENNAFFATVLRSLGYELYTTGARVSSALDDVHRDPEGYGGWSHMLIIVRLDGQSYVVDVGFGSSGPTEPMCLKDGDVVQNVPTAQARLVYKAIAPCTDSSQRMWVFEVRNSPESEWMPQYCFSELEFLPQDFTVINYWTSQSHTSWFTQRLVLTKIVLDEGQHRPIGNLTLSGTELKQRLNGESKTLRTCRSEEERTRVLEDWFDVKLRSDEIRGIQGLPSEIRPPWKDR